jgi:RNA polymerase sigma-70 factor (ECF subfamily)
MPATDEDLFLRCAQQDDDEAFDELWKRHHRGLINFFYRWVFDRDLAEDLTVEVFAKVFRSASRWEPNAKFTTFLYRAARNHWIDYGRTKGRHAKPVSLDAPISSGGFDSDDGLGAAIAGSGATPETEAQRAETARRVWAAVNDLPVELSEVFHLAVGRQMKYSDISEVMGIPEGTVKSRMFTATAKLRDALRDLAPDA